MIIAKIIAIITCIMTMEHALKLVARVIIHQVSCVWNVLKDAKLAKLTTNVFLALLDLLLIKKLVFVSVSHQIICKMVNVLLIVHNLPILLIMYVKIVDLNAGVASQKTSVPSATNLLIILLLMENASAWQIMLC